MTRSSAAMVRSEDVTEISSKGLLPQLIDVLHALTDGHESLSRKLRDARLEYSCHSALVVGRCRGVEQFASPHSSLGTSPNRSIEIHREPPTNKVELVPGPSSVNGFSNGSVPEPSNEAPAVHLSATLPEASPPNPPAAVVSQGGTPVDNSRETSARTNPYNSPSPRETTTAPVDHDYNFFDELDARLADLQDPADRSDD